MERPKREDKIFNMPQGYESILINKDEKKLIDLEKKVMDLEEVIKKLKKEMVILTKEDIKKLGWSYP